MEVQQETVAEPTVDEKHLSEEERIAKIMREMRAMMGYPV